MTPLLLESMPPQVLTRRERRKKDLSHQHRHPSVYRRRSSSVQGRGVPSLEVKAGIRFTAGSSHTDEKSSSLIPALGLQQHFCACAEHATPQGKVAAATAIPSPPSRHVNINRIINRMCQRN